MPFRLIFLMIAVLCVPSVAPPARAVENQAEPPKQRDESYTHCIDASDGITSNLMNCRGEEYARLDELMHNRLDIIRSQLTARQRNELEKSQLRWWKRIEKSCEREWITPYNSESGPGTFEMLAYGVCFLDAMNSRIHWLEKRYPVATIEQDSVNSASTEPEP